MGHVLLWVRFPYTCHSPPSPPLPPPVLPTPLSRWLDRKQSCLCALGRGIAGAAVLVLTNRGDVAGKGNPSSLLGQTGAGGALRSDFIFGDTEAKRGGGGSLRAPPPLDALIKEEEWEGVKRSESKLWLCPKSPPPWLCLRNAGGKGGG